MKTLSLLLCALLINQGQAMEFNQVKKGDFNFNYRQMGVAMAGKFNQYSAKIAFNPEKPDAARAQIDINVASIETGSDEANEEVAGRLWFNAKTYPQASFVSSGIRFLGGDRYQATGKLTIKGQTRDIVVPVTFKSTGQTGILDGTFNLKRLNYGIGEGEWRDLGTIADDIQIVFHLIVTAPR